MTLHMAHNMQVYDTVHMEHNVQVYDTVNMAHNMPVRLSICGARVGPFG